MILPVLKSVPEALAKEQEFIQWGINNMKAVISYTSDMGTLEKEKIDFDSMPETKRKKSNEESIRLFGLDNTQRYDKFKSIILARDLEKENDKEIDSTGVNMYVESSDNMVDTISYSPTAIEDAKYWAYTANRVIITPCDNLDELDNLWNEFKSTTRRQQRESDWKSIELFGINNETHYNYLKSKLLEKDIPNEEIPVEIDSESALTESYIEKRCRYLRSLDPTKDDEYIKESVSEMKKFELSYYDEVVLGRFEKEFAYNSNINSVVNTSFMPGNYMLYYTPDELDALAIDTPTNKWLDKYKFAFNDYFTNDFFKLQKERSDKVRSLMRELEFTVNEDAKVKLRSEIIANGWNPDVPISSSNLNLAKKRIDKLFNESNGTSTFIDLTESMESIAGSSRFDKIDKNKITAKSLYPVYIVLLDDATVYSVPIKKITDGPFSHVAISFDTKLDRMYTYHFSNSNRGGGLAVETIARYPKENRLALYCIFVREVDYKKLIDMVNYYLDNKDLTSYSYENYISILFNTSINRGDFKLVCSQFVDKLLKFIDVDLTKKDSSLVSPNDFYRVGRTNKKIYELFDSPIERYNDLYITRKINSLLDSKAQCIKEGYIMKDDTIIIEPVYEIKEFPVQFDKDGNLLIKKREKIDFDSEYAKSHKLLLEYDKSNNMDGIKYELAKLWYLNNKMENIIYKNSTTMATPKVYSTRAMILNDFKKYLGIIQSSNSAFNFTEYFDNTPFSDNVKKVNSSTLKFTVNYLKSIL